MSTAEAGTKSRPSQRIVDVGTAELTCRLKNRSFGDPEAQCLRRAHLVPGLLLPGLLGCRVAELQDAHQRRLEALEAVSALRR